MQCKVREEQPKVFKQPTLKCPVTLQELPYWRGSGIADLAPVTMIGLKRFKEVIVSYGMHSPHVNRY